MNVPTSDTSHERVDEMSKQRHEQEPVAHTLNCICGAVWDVSPDGVEEMVHAPNPPQRKPLTEKRIEELYSFWVVDCQDIVGFARAVERTVKGEV